MKKLLPVFLALVMLLVGACGVTTTTAVTVNGDRITQEDLDDELKAIGANQQYADLVSQGGQAVSGSAPGAFDAAFTARVLTRRIYFEVVAQEIERRKLSVSGNDLKAAEQAIQEQIGSGDLEAGAKVFNRFPEEYQRDIVRRQAEVQVLQERLGREGSSDADLRKYYDEHKAEFDQVCVMHVLTDTQPDAAAAKNDIVGGAEFGQVAIDRSKDPSAKTEGQPGFRGDLGCAPAKTYVKEFADAATSLPLNGVSDPVQTQFGFHVLRVYDRKSPTFEEVRPDIERDLAAEGGDAFTTWLQEALEKAKVDVNRRYGRFSKEDGQPQVVPPEAPQNPAAGQSTTTTIPAG